MNSIQKEREAFEGFYKTKILVKDYEIAMVDQLTEFHLETGLYEYGRMQTAWEAWQAAKASAVPETPKRKGGYYIQDLRNPIGNCMKFWYKAGYGTKHAKFFWCETYEEAKKYQGGCGWFKIWYAPYIDTLVEYTVDMQLANRDQEKTMIEAAQEQN